MAVRDVRLLGDDDVSLAHLEFILTSALTGKEDQVRYWATSLASHLSKDVETERAGERILNLLNGIKGKPVALDDVIPQPETIQQMRQRAINHQRVLAGELTVDDFFDLDKD